jgi:hypothetical protein
MLPTAVASWGLTLAHQYHSALLTPLRCRLLAFLSPPYLCWLTPHFDTALFISDATVSTLDVSLPSSLPHSTLLPMLCYLCSSAFMLLPPLSCYCAASAAVLPLLCHLLRLFCNLCQPSLLLLLSPYFATALFAVFFSNVSSLLPPLFGHAVATALVLPLVLPGPHFVTANNLRYSRTPFCRSLLYYLCSATSPLRRICSCHCSVANDLLQQMLCLSSAPF